MSYDLHLRGQDFGAQVKKPRNLKNCEEIDKQNWSYCKMGRNGVKILLYIVTSIMAPQLLLIPCAL